MYIYKFIKELYIFIIKFNCIIYYYFTKLYNYITKINI